MKGVLDMCLLSSIIGEPSYGYALVNKLAEQGLPVTSESTIYPVLKRLKANQLIAAELVPSDSGPARKVYHATPEGHEVFAEWLDDWITVRNGVDAIVTP